ncbi:MAG: Fido protein [Patescibacteria group bacterium]|nr:Fido protein [Patescibacteria group bacterium]
MKSIQKPPKWKETLNQNFEKIFGSLELKKLIHESQKEYLYWDVFKYKPMPEGFTPEEAWAGLKINRMSLYQPTPIKSNDEKYFNFALVNSLNQKLNYIDTYASGFIRTFSEIKPSEAQNNKFIMTGLHEEAIATSQIEGANTTRKVAKEMLASQRPPRTRSEQMIINSYHVMQKIDAWKNLDLSRDMLLEIQSLVTEKTLEDNNDQGRFRNDTDEIVVHDPLTGEIVHTPPKENEMLEQLDQFIAFANRTEEDGSFIHPVIKASMLHFWLAYIHPFPDGNGRTARVIFYWYLLRKEYWLIQYLSVSRAIIETRKRYDNAFIYSENDDNDLTYFIFYIADSFKTAIVKFVDYFEEKIKEGEELKKVASNLKEYNPRQIALLQYLLNHHEDIVEVNIHMTKHGVSRQTAHNDLMDLVKKGLLVQMRQKRKFIFMPNVKLIKKILNK